MINKLFQILNQLVSLLPICHKIFEKLIFNELFAFFEKRNLLSKHQSDFRPGDSCIYQLLAIKRDIFLRIDSIPSLESRRVLLDISKAFNREWYDGLLFKLKQNGVSGNLLELIKSFLSDRVQRVTLNGKTSDWECIRAGVPQGSILGPLFFLIYINDSGTDLKSNVKLFADDTSLLSIVSDSLETPNILNEDLDIIRSWAEQWKMVFTPDPIKPGQEIVFLKKPRESFHLNL